MITLRQGKYLSLTQPVKVYRNLHRRTYSVSQKGIVIGYSNEICLENCTFIVNEKGRQKVLKEKVKNVHAFVKGTVALESDHFELVKATYNPYKYPTFVIEATQVPIFTAKFVKLTLNGVFVQKGVELDFR